MKVNAVIVKNKGKSTQEKPVSISLYLSVLAVFAGLCSGTLIYCLFKESICGDVLRLFASFFYDFSSKSNPEIISGLILSALPYIFLMFIFGLDLIGAPLCLIFSFFKSLAPTLLFSYLYCEYGLKGAEYVFLVMSAGEIISVFGVLLITSCCYRMSRCLSSIYLKGKGEFPEEIRSFLLKFTVGASVIILSRFVTFLTVTGFKDLFVF